MECLFLFCDFVYITRIIKHLIRRSIIRVLYHTLFKKIYYIEIHMKYNLEEFHKHIYVYKINNISWKICRVFPISERHVWSNIYILKTHLRSDFRLSRVRINLQRTAGSLARAKAECVKAVVSAPGNGAALSRTPLRRLPAGNVSPVLRIANFEGNGGGNSSRWPCTWISRRWTVHDCSVFHAGGWSLRPLCSLSLSVYTETAYE